MKNKLLFLLFLLVFMAAADKETAWADTLTLTVERFSLGGSFILEPTMVKFTPGESYADVLEREMSRQDIQYRSSMGQYGFYLEGIAGVDCGTANIPACVQDIMTKMNLTLTENKEDGLYEFSYTNQSGWKFSVNNVFPDRGLAETYPSDGDAARLMFTLAGFGADLSGSVEQTEYLDRDTGQWVELPGGHFYDTADKSELIRLMGTANQNRAKWEAVDGFGEAYQDAVEVMAQMDAGSWEVMGAVQRLKQIQGELSSKPTNPSTTPETTITPEPGMTTTPVPGTTVTPVPEAPGTTTTPTPEVPDTTITPTPEVPQESTAPTPQPPEESTTPTPEVPEESTTPTPELPKESTTPTPELPEETAPGQASLSKVQATAYNKLKITWEKVDSADGYAICRSTSKNGTYKTVKILDDGGSTSYTDKGLSTGTFYYYKVRAYRSRNGERVYGAYSEPKGARPSLSRPVLKVSAANRQAKLKWNKVAGANGYIVSQASAKNGNYKTVKIIKKGGTLTYTKKNLKRGKTVYYRVCAYRTVNGKRVLSAYSNLKSAKVK